MNDHAKHVTDWAAFAGVVTTLAGWLPAIAALLSIIWYAIRIYDWYKRGKVSEE